MAKHEHFHSFSLNFYPRISSGTSLSLSLSYPLSLSLSPIPSLSLSFLPLPLPLLFPFSLSPLTFSLALSLSHPSRGILFISNHILTCLLQNFSQTLTSDDQLCAAVRYIIGAILAALY